MAILPIGFFMPLPLAMMIPFMGIQSAVMMKQAGENWQYGKRLQSAMTNEEFNAQTFASIYQKNVANTKEIIPDMKVAIQDMREFQDFIIVEIIELMRRGLETGLGAIFGLTAEQSNQFFGGTTGPPLLEDPTGTTPPSSGGTKSSFSEDTIKNWSLTTLTNANNNIGIYTDATQNLIVKWFIIKREEAKKKQEETFTEKPSGFPSGINYIVPPQKFINRLQVNAWNAMLQNDNKQGFATSTAKYYGNVIRQLANPRLSRSSSQFALWTNQKREILKIIADFNKSIGA